MAPMRTPPNLELIRFAPAALASGAKASAIFPNSRLE
jgi:hypothetical protein